MSGKPLSERLRLAKDSAVPVLNGPDNYRELLQDVPENVVISKALKGKFDFVHLFVANKAELLQLIDRALDAVGYDGLFWISYPKGTSEVKTDINRDSIWDILKDRGIRPVTQVSVDSTWSALRFRPAEKVGK